jgi:hypothetical protein
MIIFLRESKGVTMVGYSDQGESIENKGRRQVEP